MASVNNNRPDDFTTWAESGTFVDEPSAGRKQTGWMPGEPPSAEHLNWILKNHRDWEQYVNSVHRGVSNPMVVDGLYAHHDGAGVFSLWKDKLPITNVTQLTHKFRVAGDYSLEIIAGDVIVIAGSTGNDGAYTVSSVDLAVTGAYTSITVVEAIPDATIDGDIYTGGTVLLYNGLRFRCTAQLAFATAAAPAGGRTDRIIAVYSPSSNTLTFEYVDTGVYPYYTGAKMYAEVAKVRVDDSGGPIECLRILNSARSSLSNYIFIGDGETSFDSEPLEYVNPGLNRGKIQDAVDKVSARGGGTVYVCASGQKDYNFGGQTQFEEEVHLKSGVKLTGSSAAPLRIFQIYIQGIDGANCSTSAGTGICTLTGSENWPDYGVGSIVAITTGADIGVYVVSSIIDEKNCLLAQGDGSGWCEIPSFVGGAASATVYLTGASISENYLDSSLGIQIDQTINCSIVENFISCTDPAYTGSFKAIYNGSASDNQGLCIHGNRVAVGLDCALDFSTAGRLENASICNNDFGSSKVKITGVGSSSGIYAGNYTSSATEDVPESLSNPLGNPIVDTNKRLRFGAVDGTIEHDGAGLNITSAVGGLNLLVSAGDLNTLSTGKTNISANGDLSLASFAGEVEIGSGPAKDIQLNGARNVELTATTGAVTITSTASTVDITSANDVNINSGGSTDINTGDLNVFAGDINAGGDVNSAGDIVVLGGGKFYHDTDYYERYTGTQLLRKAVAPGTIVNAFADDILAGINGVQEAEIVPRQIDGPVAATRGFLWLPSVLGIPTGVPAAAYGSRAPVCLDSTTGKIWLYDTVVAGWTSRLNDPIRVHAVKIANQAIASGVATTVTFPSETFDLPTGHFNGATGIFTADHDGTLIRISTRIKTDEQTWPTADVIGISFEISVGGGPFSDYALIRSGKSYEGGATKEIEISGSTTAMLNSGDRIKLTAYSDVAAGFSITGGTGDTYIDIEEI